MFVNQGSDKEISTGFYIPELSVDAIESQGSAQPFEDIGVQRQAVDALEEGLDVGRTLLLLLGRSLLDGPLHKLLDAAPAEVSQGAV